MKQLGYVFCAVCFLILAGVSCAPKSDKGKPANTAQVSSQAPAGVDLGLEAFHTMVSDTPGVIIDVRTLQEFLAGHIPGAVNIDVTADTFTQKANDLDKSARVYVYCASGNRSGKAKALLLQAGFQHVFNLTHAGFPDWQAAGYPVEK